MENNDSENNVVRNMPEPVPYIVYEASRSAWERANKRLGIIIMAAIVMLFLSNAAWLWAWMQYDYSSEETVTTYEYQQDGEGVNIIGNSNEVNDVSESYDPENYTDAQAD